MYVGAGSPDYLYSFSLADGTQKWSYATGHGACKMPTYDYNAAGNKVVVSAVDWVIGLQDNGSSTAELWSPAAVNLAGAGTPYISYDGSSFFVPYTGNLTKRSMANPATSPVTVAVADISPSADIVVSSNYVYVGTTGGSIKRYDAADLTHLTTASLTGSPSVSLPLLASRTTLYVTPDNGKVHAVKFSTMAEKWVHSYSQTGNNSGAAFMDLAQDKLYTTAGNFVYKIADNSTSSAESWYYDASAAVNSGPIYYNGTVYFGKSNGSYYLLDNGTGAVRASWPKSTAAGNASAGPWIDLTNGQVIFGTTGGNLDAYDLEP
jgi:outer membrane protein assembly factor BamB